MRQPLIPIMLSATRKLNGTPGSMRPAQRGAAPCGEIAEAVKRDGAPVFALTSFSRMARAVIGRSALTVSVTIGAPIFGRKIAIEIERLLVEQRLVPGIVVAAFAHELVSSISVSSTGCPITVACFGFLPSRCWASDGFP